MHQSFEYLAGSQPLLISMPHCSSLLPDSVAATMNSTAQLSADTDWFVDKLYDFALDLGAHTLKPRFSRYYIDLNRNPRGQELYPGADNTELCPTTDFSGDGLYLSGQSPSPQEIEVRLDKSWKPYHQCLSETLSRMVSEHGYAVLLDAHSIRSRVPRFFNGQLPDFNFGTDSGNSCDASLLNAIEALDFGSWSQVSNGRFKGGYITRTYGRPEKHIHAIQLELSQATYMHESTDESRLAWDDNKATAIKVKLQQIIETLLDYQG